jgi:hypothetical protein
LTIPKKRFKIYLETKLRMMIKTILLLLLLCFGASLFAQKFPIDILPDSTLTIKAVNDTLWVLKNSQLRKAIIAGKKLEIEEQISIELRKKILLMEEKDRVKDSLVSDVKKDRDYYIKNWNTCKTDVDLLIKQHQRQKLFTRLSLAGIVVAFVAGLFIGK